MRLWRIWKCGKLNCSFTVHCTDCKIVKNCLPIFVLAGKIYIIPKNYCHQELLNTYKKTIFTQVFKEFFSVDIWPRLSDLVCHGYISRFTLQIVSIYSGGMYVCLLCWWSTFSLLYYIDLNNPLNTLKTIIAPTRWINAISVLRIYICPTSKINLDKDRGGGGTLNLHKSLV